ncbi:Uncharacterised protein [uncultured archaeon]|nr:Uncharacterised protein [uncultured archaeon]
MEIDKISGPLKNLLREKEIIARCELLLRTYEIVRTANLNDQESQEIKKLVGDKVAPGVFANILSQEPIFFDLPRLDTYTQMSGRIFHFIHTKRYSRQDFANANSKFLRSIPELKEIMCQILRDMLKKFMADAGYSLIKEGATELVFSAPKRQARCFAVTSINALDIDKFQVDPESDSIILVPSSESLEPFMQFFREKGQAAEEKGLQIWITNLEKGTLDPFIGYTTDLDIYNQFDNPRLAEMVRNNWNTNR